MLASRLTTPPDPLAPALLRAENAAACLRLVARAYERPAHAVARELTPRDLEQETAQALVRLAREAAWQRHRAQEEPPDGDDLFTQVTRGAQALIRAEAARIQNEEAERRLAERLGR